jgi:hypothetical protein
VLLSGWWGLGQLLHLHTVTQPNELAGRNWSQQVYSPPVSAVVGHWPCEAVVAPVVVAAVAASVVVVDLGVKSNAKESVLACRLKARVVG